mgnify:CR=1 FL=1
MEITNESLYWQWVLDKNYGKNITCTYKNSLSHFSVKWIIDPSGSGKSIGVKQVLVRWGRSAALAAPEVVEGGDEVVESVVVSSVFVGQGYHVLSWYRVILDNLLVGKRANGVFHHILGNSLR